MERAPEPYAGRVRAPAFPPAVDWIGSGPIELASLRGKVVLLDFWTSGCINCIHVLPNLERLHRAFPDRLQIIGVHSPKFPAERDPERLALAVERLEISHPVVSDPDYAIWQSFAVDAWPTLVFIDPRGRVVARHAGEFDYDLVHAYVEQLLSPSPQVIQSGAEDRSRLPGHHARATMLRFPGRITIDPAGQRLFIADSGHHRIVVASLEGSVKDTIGTGAAGAEDGPLESATFRNPQGMALAPDGGSLLLADAGNHLLRRIDLTGRTVERVAGTGVRGFPMESGPAREIALASPWDVLWFEGRALVAMAGTHQIWAWDPATERLDLLAGTGVESIHDDLFEQATFAQPTSLAALGRTVFVADAESSAVRALDFDTGRVRRVVGRGLFHFGDLDAIGDSVRLQHPQGIVATEEQGEPVLYVADTFNNKIKRIDPVRRRSETIAGTGEQGHRDGDALDATFREPSGVALYGRTLLIADTHNHVLRRLDLDREVVESVTLG